MLEMYFLSSPGSGALMFLYEDEDEKWGIHVTNPLNAELNPICHLLTLLGAHHILHVSRIRVKGQCCSDAEGHKDVCCNVNDCVSTGSNTS